MSTASATNIRFLTAAFVMLSDCVSSCSVMVRGLLTWLLFGTCLTTALACTTTTEDRYFWQILLIFLKQILACKSTIEDSPFWQTLSIFLKHFLISLRFQKKLLSFFLLQFILIKFKRQRRQSKIGRVLCFPFQLQGMIVWRKHFHYWSYITSVRLEVWDHIKLFDPPG